MNYWVRDGEGRVFGPAQLPVLRELLSRGRLRGVTDVSEDGILWQPAGECEALAGLLSPAPAGAGEEPRVEELRELLASWKGKPAHEVFSLPPTADADTVRRTYLALVKDFHPARLPANASPALRAATVDVFQFLGTLMKSVQPQQAPSATTPAPTWSIEEFVGFDRKADDKLEMRVVVGRAQAGIFSQHPLMNLARGAMFVPTQSPPELGTVLDLVLVVGQPAREVRAAGRVAWACSPGGRGQPGVGVSFTRIESIDRDFLERFVRESTEPPRKGG